MAEPLAPLRSGAFRAKALHRGLLLVTPQKLNRMLRLEYEPVAVRLLVALGESPLDRFHCGPRLRGEQGREGLRLIQCTARRGEVIHDPQAKRIEGLHLLPAQEDLERPRPTDDLREPRRGTVARHPSEIDFRVREDRAL